VTTTGATQSAQLRELARLPAASDAALWLCALGYFACYVPYSALTKALSRGVLPGMVRPLDGVELLPVTSIAGCCAALVFVTIAGWWRYATQLELFGRSLPRPRRATAQAGVCSAVIVVTTTLAYTFEGVSIVLAMLLMRGGVLAIAPIVDALSRRRVRWYSWTALALSALSLFVVFLARGGTRLSIACAVDIALYLGAYFVRLRLMSRMAKSIDVDANRRFFVEEQIVTMPLVVAVLGAIALVDAGPIAHLVRRGFTDIWGSGVLDSAILVGLLSQGTGIFGALILLDRRENTYCVPVNRASSLLAGVVATAALSFVTGQPFVRAEGVGAVLVVAAVLVLSIPPLVERRAARARAGPPS